jgi:hypothetical protein
MAATNVLKQAGYAVDYYSGQEVTVDLYRTLPTHGYKLLILRVHSSATGAGGQAYPVTLFTSERYSETRYAYEQLTDQLTTAAYSFEEKAQGVVYFGIKPSFVTESTQGSFQKALVVMMGCQGLENTEMANAFVNKGARVFVSWSDSVTASHTDTATVALLQQLAQGKSVQEAVNTSMKLVGPDPLFNSRLAYFPADGGNSGLHQNSTQGLIMSLPIAFAMFAPLMAGVSRTDWVRGGVGVLVELKTSFRALTVNLAVPN